MKLSNLYLVGGLVALIGISSFNQPFNNAHAALTAPTTWTFKYTNQDSPGFKLRNSTSVISTPNYSRTADSTYFNYTSTFTITTGLTATQTFNRSNSTWYDAGSGNYIPSAAAVGSSSNYVGSAFNNRIQLTINNQTQNNYVFWLDLSSSSTDFYFDLFYDNSNYYFYDTDVLLSKNTLKKIYLPAYTEIDLNSLAAGSIAMYLDAWYLQDLGVSSAYEAGVDDGIIQGEQSADSTVLLDAVETVVGVAINFILMIMTFSIFDISLLNIALVLVAVLGIIWILKALRG
jgi:hypothetical protein